MDTLLDHTLNSLKEFLLKLNEKPYRADQIFDWIYKKGILHPSDMTNLPLNLREKLSDSFHGNPLSIESRLSSKDGSEKVLLRNMDISVEAVMIPSENDRITFCLSTQAGCPVGCTFCETGKMGFIRNLSAGEIVAQILLLEKETKRPDNIVLMGMGEALLNFDEVDNFVNIIKDQKGYGLSERRITISTAGLMDELMQFHLLHPRVELAVSLNASNDKTRKILMPHKKLDSCTEIILKIPHFDCTITLEYVLIKGINDSRHDARELAEAIRQIKNVKVNLIRYNETSSMLESPSRDSEIEFQSILLNENIKCFIRKSLGSDINAACGQLAAKKAET